MRGAEKSGRKEVGVFRGDKRALLVALCQSEGVNEDVWPTLCLSTGYDSWFVRSGDLCDGGVFAEELGTGCSGTWNKAAYAR